MTDGAWQLRAEARHRLRAARASASALTRALRLPLVLAIIALLPRIDAATKYVSKRGSDGNDGSTPATAYLTIAHALREIGAGGRLYIGGGIYAEAIINTIPSGASADARTIVTNYENEVVTLRPNPGPARVLEFGGATAYITFAANGRGQIILDGTNVGHNVVKFSSGSRSSAGRWPMHIRLRNLEIKNAHDSGVLGFPMFCEFIDLTIHDAGRTVFDHGMYLEGSDNVIDGCDIYANFARGIQIFMSGRSGDTVFASRNTVRNCRIHDNGRGKPTALKPGIDADSGTGNRIYNNLIYGNGQYGLMIQSGGTAAEVFNNTFYGNGGGAIFIKSSAGGGPILRNNLGCANGGAAQVIDERRDAIVSHNLWTTTARFVSTDALSPDFLKLAADFILAIDQGTSSSPVGALVTHDYWGNARPQGGGFDIGAHEYVGATLGRAQE